MQGFSRAVQIVLVVVLLVVVGCCKQARETQAGVSGYA
jgi:uncharacterized lipoprotein YehR (DUF1307 family)